MKKNNEPFKFYKFTHQQGKSYCVSARSKTDALKFMADKFGVFDTSDYKVTENAVGKVVES